MKSARWHGVALDMAGGLLAPPGHRPLRYGERTGRRAAKLALAQGDVTPEEGL